MMVLFHTNREAYLKGIKENAQFYRLWFFSEINLAIQYLVQMLVCVPILLFTEGENAK